jgi:hypothetical protein
MLIRRLKQLILAYFPGTKTGKIRNLIRGLGAPPSIDRCEGAVTMGDLISTEPDLAIEVMDASSNEKVPGLGWTLSNEAIETIREIDANIRAAEQISGRLLAS